MARKRAAGAAAEKKIEKPAVKPAEKTEEKSEEKITLKALIEFRDRDGKSIRKGEEYSHADAEYIEYLQGNKNKTGAPVIGK